MAKTMKRNYKKSKKVKRRGSKKNIKRVSLKNLHKGHKLRKTRHYSRGLHKRGMSRHGGKKMRGGMVSSPAAGPVGYSWDGGNIATWPGASASEGLDTNGATMSNHFSLSKNGVAVGGIELPRSTNDDQILKGGKLGRRKRHKGQKGGFFQEILNLGRGAQDGINSGYYNLVGKTQPWSDNPWSTEQPIDEKYKYIGQIPSSVRQIYIDANNQVAKI